jgi:hypothetical protein
LFELWMVVPCLPTRALQLTLVQNSSRKARRIPSKLHGRCVNCLSYSHRVSTCQLPQRCLHCHDFRHLARDCKWRSAATMVEMGADLPRHSACGNKPPASQHVPHGGPPSSKGPRRVPRRNPAMMLAATEEVGEGNQRCSICCCTLLLQARSGDANMREPEASHVGRPNAGGARRLGHHHLANRSTSAWEPA